MFFGSPDVLSSHFFAIITRFLISSIINILTAAGVHICSESVAGHVRKACICAL